MTAAIPTQPKPEIGTTIMGRPRDASITDRVLDAALTVYAERGWTGFNFEAVAKLANVGRPALYRRWDDRAELLVAAFRSRTWGITVEQRGSLREELAAIAMAYSRVMTGSRAMAGLRLFLDQAAQPDILLTVYKEITGKRSESIENAISRAVLRGEVPPDTSATRVIRLLLGSIILWGFAPDSGELLRPSEPEIYEHIGVILHGLTYGAREQAE